MEVEGQLRDGDGSCDRRDGGEEKKKLNIVYGLFDVSIWLGYSVQVTVQTFFWVFLWECFGWE